MCEICTKYHARHLNDGEAITGTILDTTRIITADGIETVVVVQPDPLVLHIRGWSKIVTRELIEQIARNGDETI